MTSPELVTGDLMVQCQFCYRFEQDSSDNWNIYKGYGFSMAHFGRKKLVVPWVLDQAQTQVEHHRVCGATRLPGALFHSMRGFTGWRCSSCGRVWQFHTSAQPIRDYYWELADRCCSKSKLKTTEM